MKLQAAFKLSALAIAVAVTTTTNASTLDVAALAPSWESARDEAPNTADREGDGKDVSLNVDGKLVGTIPGLGYQYTDVGSSGIFGTNKQEVSVTNQLTELYRNGDKDKFLVKISPLGSDSASDGITYEFDDQTLKADLATYLGSVGKPVVGNDWLKNVDAKDIAAFFTDRVSSDPKYLLTPGTLVEVTNPIADQINPEMVFLAGLTKNETGKASDLKDIRRLDSSYLEYAHESKSYLSSKDLGGNLTNDNSAQSLVLANTGDKTRPDITLEKTSAGVINGILNNKDANDQEVDVNLDQRVYGLKVHSSYEQYDEEGKSLIASAKNFAQVEATKIQVTSETLGKGTQSTIITSEGITTDSLTVGGVNVGQALGNAAVLGNLSTTDINNLVNSGETLSALDTKVDTLDTKLTTEVERLDGRIDAGLSSNAQASTTYTDKEVAAAKDFAQAEDVKTLTAAQNAAKAEDVKTLTAAQNAAKAEDVKTLTAANAYVDAQVSGFNSRVNQLNTKINDVEKTAYRGTAIALAAQQQVPNIKPGQYALFGGVGHYESESAVAMGVVGAINERTSISGAIGVAGGSEVGGRVGVAYVFGGK